MFDAPDSEYLVPFDGSFRVPHAATESTRAKKSRDKDRLKDASDKLDVLQQALYANDRHAILLIFQGMDAAGKDSTIRAVMKGINPAGCQVFAFKKPSDKELDHDFLWRTSRVMPERGRPPTRIGAAVINYRLQPAVTWREQVADVARAVARKVSIPVFGVIENMATHICSNCGHEEAIFGAGGGDDIVTDFGVPLLARLPLDARIREQTDSGKPTVVAEPDSAIAQAFREAAWNIGAAQAAERVDHSSKFGPIVVEPGK